MNPASETESRTLHRLGIWLLTWLIVVLAPLLLLDRLLSEAIETGRRQRLEEARERARTAMTTLEEHLDRPNLLAEALRQSVARWPAFVARAGAGTRSGAWAASPSAGIGIEAARAFSATFRRRFPAGSALYWFDATGSWITVDPSPPPEGMRVWQSVFRLADRPKEAGALDRRLVANFLQTRLGPLAKPSLIEGLSRQPLEILLRGRPYFLAFHRLPAVSPGATPPGAGTPNSLLVLLPLFEARPGWELRLAARRLSRLDLTIGGIWLSDNRSVGRRPLDPGLLHGLSTQYRAGTTTVIHAGHLFLTQSSTRDADLLLAVAVRLDGLSHGRTGESLEPARVANGLLIVLSGLLAIVLGWLGWKPRISLAVKTWLGTLLLAGLPLSAMLLFGLRHLGQLDSIRLETSRKRIQSRLDRFDQEMAEARIAARDQIRRLTTSRAFVEGADSRLIRKTLVGLVHEFGLRRVIFWHRNGRSIRWGWSNGSRNRLAALQLELIRQSIRAQNLEGAGEIELPPSLSSDTAFISKKVSISGSHNARKGFEGVNTLQRLQEMQLGTSGWFFYQDFLTDPVTGRCLGYFNLTFDRRTILRRLTKRAGDNLPRDGIRVSWQPPEEAGRKSAGFPARLMAQARRAAGQVEELQETSSGRLLGVGRPSKGFSILTASTLRLDRNNAWQLQATQWLAAALCLGLGFAFLAARLAGRYLLEPVRELHQALLAVSGGEYPRLDRFAIGDELGELAGRYHQMVAGLEEKARMSRFLRSDLTDRDGAAHRTRRRVESRQAVLLFAGLRDFTAFEATTTPEAAMGLMNTFLGTVEEQVRLQGGEIDKFIGDTAMAVFLAAPAGGIASPASRAVAAALAIRRIFGGSTENRLPLAFGIGLAAGTVVTGPIGSERRRLDFTVIGDPVNLAARLEKLAGRPGMPEILVDHSVQAVTPGEWRETPIDSVRGRSQGTRVFTPCSEGKPS